MYTLKGLFFLNAKHNQSNHSKGGSLPNKGPWWPFAWGVYIEANKRAMFGWFIGAFPLQVHQS
jgi:hypothetical protein